MILLKSYLEDHHQMKTAITDGTSVSNTKLLMEKPNYSLVWFMMIIVMIQMDLLIGIGDLHHQVNQRLSSHQLC